MGEIFAKFTKQLCNMLHPFVQGIQSVFIAAANAELAVPMSAYMKHLFPFHGIKAPERRKIQSQYIKQYGIPAIDDLKIIVTQLWQLPEREYQYFALDLMEKMLKRMDESHLSLLVDLVGQKSWWDTVDSLATHLIGALLLKYPALVRGYNNAWLVSDNIWLQRTAILFQLKYKQQTDEQLLFQNILTLSTSKEFFIRKAIGWALREYAYTAPQTVMQFVDANTLSTLSKREALKHIKTALNSQ